MDEDEKADVRKLRPSSEKKAQWVRQSLDEGEGASASLYERFTAVGTTMGLTGEALATFVTQAVQKEEEMKLKKEEVRLLREREERNRMKEEEELKMLRNREEREREREEREKEREERMKLKEEEELALKRERERREKEREERMRLKEEEELALKREELDYVKQTRGSELELKRAEAERHHINLDPLSDDDDVDAYLAHFERVAVLCKWSQTSWSTRLIALLRGKAREAILRLAPELLSNYTEVKAALLTYFRLDAEAYRRKFRKMRRENMETFSQLLDRLKSCFSLWCLAAGKDENKAEDVRDVFLQEQLYNGLSHDIVTEVKRVQPVTAEEIAQEATKLIEARRMGREVRAERRAEAGHNKDVSSGQKEDERVMETKSLYTRQEERTASNQATGGGQKCFKCGKQGHKARFCWEAQPVARVKIETEDVRYKGKTPTLCLSCSKKDYTPVCEVTVNGVSATGLRDTGAACTVVAEHLVPQECYVEGTMRVVLAKSRCHYRLPMAVVDMDSPFYKGKLLVLVMKEPVEQVLIGNRGQCYPNGPSFKLPVYADRSLGAAQARAQARRANGTREVLPLKEHVLAESPEQVRALQDRDVTLKGAREAAKRGSRFPLGDNEVTYTYKDGVLVRQYKTPQEAVVQVCVPRELRVEVMTLAHDVPMAGHLGVAKTKARVARHFYWPGMFQQIARYCRSCIQCRRTIDRGKQTARVVGCALSRGRETSSQFSGTGRMLSQICSFLRYC